MLFSQTVRGISSSDRDTGSLDVGGNKVNACLGEQSECFLNVKPKNLGGRSERLKGGQIPPGPCTPPPPKCNPGEKDGGGGGSVQYSGASHLDTSGTEGVLIREVS